jgi:SAM-dependent methyltransferase
MTMESLSKIAHQRLHPSLTNPNYLVLRSRARIFGTWADSLPAKELTILDIGGRYQPYRPLFEGRIRRYVAIDLEKTEFVTAVANGEALPFADNAFDLVIATQVFEYFREPQRVGTDIYRVLKPGGMLLASLVGCAPRFVDEERWRFTPGGIRLLLAPFDTVEIVPELYSVGSLVRTINLALHTFVRYRFARAIYDRTLCPLLNLLGLALEGLNLTHNDQFAANFSVRAAKKPA